MVKLRYWGAALAAACVAIASAAVAQMAANKPDPNHPGRALYQARCATCHDNPGQTRAATFEQLAATSPTQLRIALSEGGVMYPMAQGLSRRDLGQLIGYLTSGQAAAAADWDKALMCAEDNRKVDVSGPVVFGGFGADLRSTRSLTAAQAGLKKADMSRLEIAWAIAFPQTQAMGSGVAVLGDTAFANAGGRIMALDAAKGCARWMVPLNSRNTPQIADLGGRKVLALSAGRGDVVVLDAATGAEVWRASGLPRGGGSIRGGVVVYKDKVIVPISNSGVGAGMNATFECCVGHGAVVALSLKDGSKLWEYHTMEDAKYNGQVSRTGVKQRGPSGAPIWSMPTIDEKRGRILVSTGENTSHPATNTSDAVIALDLETGKEVWVWQGTPSDVWNMSCNDRELQKSGPNCPNLFTDNPVGRDWDFGATPVLVTVGGKDVVWIGQKSGHAWALDAATGKLLWSDRVGEGSPLGGVHWGVTTDGALGFLPIADPVFEENEQDRSKAGVYGYRLRDGKQVWAHSVRADCPPERKKFIVNCTTKYGYSAAPLTVDGAVIAGTLDGKLVALDGASGKVLKVIDTAGPVKTINAIPGQGGSIDAHAISAGAGSIFVGSGYSQFGQTPGNVLIALRPKK